MMKGKATEEVAPHRKGSRLQLLDLPADILINIISRLEIRDAIRTSVLSSHCRYLWCDHANLVFHLDSLSSDRERYYDVPGFLDKVDSVLEQHSGAGVNAMYVFCLGLLNTHANHIDKWVKFAVESRTKELSLHLSYPDVPAVSRAHAYDFPCHFFSHGSSYLRCLRLTAVSLNLPSDISAFLNLKELRFTGVTITGEHLEHLLTRCNLLESVSIAYCEPLTSIRALHPSSMNRLKHLAVHKCAFLQRIEMNCGQLTALEYTGRVVPLVFASLSGLRNVSIYLLPFDTALDYMTTGFPSILPHLETLTLQCRERKRSTFPARPVKFMYLRHLSLKVAIYDWENTDVLVDYAYLLNAAPLLEKLELHMGTVWYHRPYLAENYGKLRSLTLHSNKHTHLKSVYFTGFLGYKNQVELALHILHTSAVLQSFKIDPEVKLRSPAFTDPYGTLTYIDGFKVAKEFVCKADHKNVVQVVEVSVLNPMLA